MWLDVGFIFCFYNKVQIVGNIPCLGQLILNNSCHVLYMPKVFQISLPSLFYGSITSLIELKMLSHRVQVNIYMFSVMWFTKRGLLKLWVALELRSVILGCETNWLDKSDLKVFFNLTRKLKVGLQWIYLHCFLGAIQRFMLSVFEYVCLSY